jgi:hypothetical protein
LTPKPRNQRSRSEFPDLGCAIHPLSDQSFIGLASLPSTLSTPASTADAKDCLHLPTEDSLPKEDRPLAEGCIRLQEEARLQEQDRLHTETSASTQKIASPTDSNLDDALEVGSTEVMYRLSYPKV